MKPLYDPAIPLLGIYPEETKIEKDTCIPFFTKALFTTVRTWRRKWKPTPVWVGGEPGGLLSMGLHRVGHD